MAVPSAPDESRRRRGGRPDASATTRRVVFLLWGGASADPASLHDDDEGASWPSLVLQTSRVDGMGAFRCVSRVRRRPSLSDFLVGIAGAKRAKKSAAVQPFHECTGVKVTTRPANHCCSERDRAPRQPAKTKKSSQSTQPQECNHATRQRREQHLRSHSQKKWTPSAAPTPTAPKLCRASRRASI